MLSDSILDMRKKSAVIIESLDLRQTFYKQFFCDLILDSPTF